jgi:hypothetical protein
MTWTLHVAKRAQKQLEKAPAKNQRQLRATLLAMEQDPFGGTLSVLNPNAPPGVAESETIGFFSTSILKAGWWMWLTSPAELLPPTDGEVVNLFGTTD